MLSASLKWVVSRAFFTTVFEHPGFGRVEQVKRPRCLADLPPIVSGEDPEDLVCGRRSYGGLAIPNLVK